MKKTLLHWNMLMILLGLTVSLFSLVVLYVIPNAKPDVLEKPSDVFSEAQTDPIYKALSIGETLFKENCKSCHAIHTQEVGPALKNILGRRSKEWSNQFIRDSEVLIREKDSVAIRLTQQFGGLQHIKFPRLTDDQLNEIYKYIETDCIGSAESRIISCY